MMLLAVVSGGGDNFRKLVQSEVASKESNLIRTRIPPNSTKGFMEIASVFRTTEVA